MHDACRFQKLEIAIVEFLLIRLSFFAGDQFRDGLFSSLFLSLFFANFSFVVRTDLHKSLPTTKEGDARLSVWGPEMSLPVVFCRGDAGAYWVRLIGLTVLGKKKNSGLALTVRGRRKRLGEISL